MATIRNKVPCTKYVCASALPIMPLSSRSSRTLPTVSPSSMPTNMGQTHQPNPKAIYTTLTTTNSTGSSCARDQISHNRCDTTTNHGSQPADTFQQTTANWVETVDLQKVHTALDYSYQPTWTANQQPSVCHKSHLHHLATSSCSVESTQLTPTSNHSTRSWLLTTLRNSTTNNTWSPTAPKFGSNDWTHWCWAAHDPTDQVHPTVHILK